MRKNRIPAYITAFIVCAVLLIQPSSFAQNAISEAGVEFVAGTGPTYPVHPEFPDTDENGGPVEGSLAIVSVSYLDFGIIPVASTTQLFDIETILPNIQVVDLRGTATGWNVSASVSRFKSGTDNTLPGASIHIIDGRPNSVSGSPAPSQIPNTELTTDAAPIRIITANDGAGTGLWVMRWYPEDTGKYVKLEIPAGSATLGSHTATINWILGNTP